MKNEIQEVHIREVFLLVSEVSSVKYHAHKKREFANQVDSLSPQGKWLLAFCYWHCLFNPRFKHVDETAYFGVPYEGQQENKTFLDFISVLRSYDRITITPRRGAELGRFLSGTHGAHREFYLGLIGGNIINALPQHEAQVALDIDDIISEEIYAVTKLHSSFDTLAYPIALRAISDDSRPLFGGIIKRPRKISTFGDSPSIDRDIKFSINPQFALTGFNICGKFYPTDFFSSPDKLRSYGGSEGMSWHDPYDQRVGSLNKFLKDNLITEMDGSAVQVLYQEEDLMDALTELIPTVGPARLLLTDSDSSLRGNARTFDVGTAVGIIEELWVEDGNPLGVRCWFNGTIRNIPFKFEGTKQAILTAHDRLRDQPFRFYRTLINNEEILIGQTILWDAKKWRPNRMKKTRMWIEKCAFCGATSQKHASRGVCKSCEINLRYHFAKHGVGKYIKPSAIMRRSRLATCWHPDLLNLCFVTHKGYLVRASSDGHFMFEEHHTTMINYMKQKEDK